VWFGAPAFDVAEATSWAAKVFAAEKAFFDDRDRTPYYLVVRSLPGLGERANGMGQPSSFLSAIGPKTTWGPRLRTNLAHEMLHRWLGLRLRPPGPEGEALWFTEGFTVHYAAALTFRAGLISRDELLGELNGVAARHFANPRANATDAEIAAGVFDDDQLSVVPYTRGALFAAELHEKTRDALARRPQIIGELLDAELRTRFDEVIRKGATPRPRADAFGPGLMLVARAWPLYELGFDERASRAAGKVVGLRSGSNAARAGLREGDVLNELDARPLFPDTKVTARTARGDFSWLPASATTRDGFAWAPAPE
jgi:predicted metalloprotease with PDZ domain